MSRFWWKKICLYHVRQAEKPYYHASRGLTSECGFQQSNLQTRWYWVQQDIDNGYISLSTGRLWQAGNKRITGSLQQEYSLGWTSTRWCGSHPTRCGSSCSRCGMCGCGDMRFAKTIRFGIRHCTYNNYHMTNINNGTIAPQSFKPFRGQDFSYFVLH